jgi:ribosome biogenesis GTPase
MLVIAPDSLAHGWGMTIATDTAFAVAVIILLGRRVPVELRVFLTAAVIVAVEERRAWLSRRDPSRRRNEQILVANVDAVLIVAAVCQPPLAPALVDRFLVAAESRELDAAIVLNKVDLDPERSYGGVAAVYRDLGYPVIEVSVETRTGLDAVRTFLADRTTMLLGHSGVGKSSLANALDPSLALRTGDVHDQSGKGMHTTTSVSLLRLPWGGYLVDTPGIREFEHWDMQPGEVGNWFRDIAAHAAECRFGDCCHEHEPDCAVKRAVSRDRIARWRYDSYCRQLASLREDANES